MINPELKVGDKVVLLTMEGEPGMSYGEKGIVERISVVFGHKQYRVKWENDRSLDLLEDADERDPDAAHNFSVNHPLLNEDK